MKLCTRCLQSKSLDAFATRAKSKDGRAAACKLCVNESSQVTYWVKDGARRKHIDRVVKNKQERFTREPAYKRAFNLWGSTKHRTKIPGWVGIIDFVTVCQEAIDLGPEYEIDHIIPINHPLVCGLHVPANVQVVQIKENQRKGNTFSVLDT